MYFWVNGQIWRTYIQTFKNFKKLEVNIMSDSIGVDSVGSVAILIYTPLIKNLSSTTSIWYPVKPTDESYKIGKFKYRPINDILHML